MAGIVYVNGQYLADKEACVSVFDRGFCYGDGVFETLRAYKGHIFRLIDHLERLQRAAARIYLNVPESPDKLETILYEILKRNELSDAILRATLTRGASDGEFDIDPSAPPTLVVTARPAERLPETFYKEGVTLALVPDCAPRLPGVNAQVKAASFLPYVLARKLARDRGYWDGILLNARGELCDASTSNVFVVQESTLKTPPVNESVLSGITRKVVLELARHVNVTALEMPLVEQDVYEAQEVFLTNTGIELLPVTAVEGHPIGSGRPGPVRRKLHAEFLKSIESL